MIHPEASPLVGQVVTVTTDDGDRDIEVQDWFDRVVGVAFDTDDDDGGGVLYGHDTETGLMYAFFVAEIVP